MARAGHAAKDQLLVLDDFKTVRKDVQDEIWQNLGDRTGRARAKSDLTMHRTYVIQAAVLSNGENLPQGFLVGDGHGVSVEPLR